MSQTENSYGLRGQPLYVGLSSIVGVTVIAGQNFALLKYSSGGSLEIGGVSLSWGLGYLFNTGEALSLNSYGTVYLAATGATVTTMLLRGLSSGNT